MRSDEDARLIEDAGMLSERHVPDDLPAREDQLSTIASALAPAAKRQKAIHCWIHGDPGTGKTAAARTLLRRLKADTSVRGLYINCWEYPTYFSVLDRMVRELRVLGAERLAVSFKLERLQRYLDQDPLILVLDEIDQPVPKERHSILYNLSQLGNVGLICVCNSEHTYFSLDERVKSRINALQVFFPGYSRDELAGILARRAHEALASGGWSDRCLDNIARLSDGDARTAVQTLRNAAMLAEVARAPRIRTEHIRGGWHSAKTVKTTYLLRDLTDHHRLLYELIANRPGVLSGDLWRVYQNACRGKELCPIAVRTYSDYCNHLAEAGLIEAKRAPIQGKVREFRAIQ